MDNTEKLLFFNAFNFLSNILAMEEHAVELTSEEVAHSHCMNKHAMQGYGHHLREFLNHCQRHEECREKVLPKMEKYVAQFKEDVVKPLTEEGKPVELLTIISKRNEFRELVSILFPSLAKVDKGCPICELDNEHQFEWLAKQSEKGKASA